MNNKIFTLNLKHSIYNISSILSDSFKENNHSDVTLVSDDKIEFLAHKYVLVASSPVFENILLSNSHPHSLIYLRGVKYQELGSILQFIYLGEVSIYRSNRTRLFQAAKDLQITHLAETCVKEKSFTTQEEKNMTGDINNQDKQKSDEQNIPTYNPVSLDAEPIKESYICEECGKSFKCKRSFLGHIKIIHRGIGISCK